MHRLVKSRSGARADYSGTGKNYIISIGYVLKKVLRENELIANKIKHYQQNTVA